MLGVREESIAVSRQEKQWSWLLDGEERLDLSCLHLLI